MRTRTKKQSGELDFAGRSAGLEAEVTKTESAPIPTGGNPSEEIGGVGPAWTKNLCVELLPGYVVERVDDMNWQAKYVKRSESRGSIVAKTARRWESAGWYGSPGYAARRLYLIAVAEDQIGAESIESFVDRLESLMARITPAVIAGERAKAIDEAAALVSVPADAEKLRVRAREYAQGVRS